MSNRSTAIDGYMTDRQTDRQTHGRRYMINESSGYIYIYIYIGIDLVMLS